MMGSPIDPHRTPVMDSGEDGVRVVTCDLDFAVVEPSEIVLQVMASRPAGPVRTERFTAHSDGAALTDVTELAGPNGARVQVVPAPPGRLVLRYRGEIGPAPGRSGGPLRVDDGVEGSAAYERLVYRRPSRYCPSDHLVGFAVAEFGIGASVRHRVESITGWIRDRIGYVAGSSSVHDSAEDTLLTGMGTCRDFAHLGVALCRAVGIPARFAAVYAPGLSPMDFHAVFETMDEEGRWYAHDATDLAPRSSMVRIVTGRDAADAAFASVDRGIAVLDGVTVTATVGGGLPVGDPSALVQLP
jgi:transglutaminase-like putative cysteine protease